MKVLPTQRTYYAVYVRFYRQLDIKFSECNFKCPVCHGMNIHHSEENVDGMKKGDQRNMSCDICGHDFEVHYVGQGHPDTNFMGVRLANFKFFDKKLDK